MLPNPEIAFELAQLDIREHQRRAALDALAAQLETPAPGAFALLPATAAATRTRLAEGLRGIAVRLDPTLNCDPASTSALVRVPTPR